MIKTTLAIAVAALLLTAGVASAASPSAKELSQNPAKVHKGPANAEVPAGEPTITSSKKQASNRAMTSTLHGYITSSGGLSMPNAAVTIQYWNGYSWINGSSQRTGANGYYSFSATPGWHYRISAAAVVSQCRGGLNGSIATYQGTSGFIKAQAYRAHRLDVPLRNTSFRFC